MEEAADQADAGKQARDRREIGRGVGANIARWRRARRLTQADVATAAGCGRTAVARWESGERLPSLPMLARLAGALGCEPADLLLGVRPVAPLPITPAVGEDEEE